MPFASPADWEAWLEDHHAASDGVWIKIAKKDAGIESVSHAEALEIALCFGWIDSLARGYDDVSRIQRFSPRKPRSAWSKSNVERVQRLVDAGRMRQAGQREIDAAKADGRWPTS
jgi:uncharacterized protein YdeI (YjbR/CyaY-like superfamily)